MAINGSTWSQNLKGKLLKPAGTWEEPTGDTSLHQMCNAIGSGSASHIIGKTFTTTDIGTAPGIGSGTKTGFSGIIGNSVGSNIKMKFLMRIAPESPGGDELDTFCNAVGQEFQTQMEQASLSTTHTLIFTGSANMVTGSISVIASIWKELIKSMAPVDWRNFAFPQGKWEDLVDSIVEAFEEALLQNASATFVISGTPTSIYPFPSSGTGTGTIS